MPLNALAWNAMKTYHKSQMTYKDIRVNLVNEILNGIKVLKLYTWEESFTEKIVKIRSDEIKAIKGFQYLEGSQMMVWNCAPILVAISSFASYVLLDSSHVLDARTTFVSLTLFNTLKKPLFVLPTGIVNVIQGIVSLKRIKLFLNADEIDPTMVSHNKMNVPIIMNNASFAWGKDRESKTLHDISFSAKQGSLIAVVGRVGSGKSSFLSALLGEMNKTEGFINVSGSIAYVSQQAWIRNQSVKANILFGKSFSSEKYDNVLDTCALNDDLKLLPGGDSTEIGEKGINLSGGQKQRINLARAVYANRDVYLLDDPLSAVDAHVGKHIFENVIGPKGVLNNKTRILVTHSVNYLPEIDMIVALKDGCVVDVGSYDNLIAKKGEFFRLISEQLEEKSKESIQFNHNDNKKVKDISAPKNYSNNDYINETEVGTTNESQQHLQIPSETENSLITAEHMETSGVKVHIYWYYIKSCGITLVLTSVFVYSLYQIVVIMGNLLLSLWSDDKEAASSDKVQNYYLTLYGIMGISQSIFLLIAIVLMTHASLQASLKLHDELMKRVLNSPMSFFDTTPLGRIVNRFSKDMDDVDELLPVNFKDVTSHAFSVLGTVFILIYISVKSILAIIPMLLLFIIIQNLYVKTSRQLKRLISVNRSPINSLVDETLAGIATIRAFGFQANFEKENEFKLDNLQNSVYHDILSGSWLFLRLQSINFILVTSVALITVINRDSLDPGVVGLSLSYALTCQIDIYYLVKYISELEKAIVSVERIKEYQETPQEAMSETPNDPDQSWPEYGNIKFDHYSTRYRPGLDLVLSDINCCIKSGEKIGIVGRTGAGKSSITLSLFRIIESAAGAISIDGVNIAQIGLTRLRSALTIIPQDPVLFSGTLRFNLDPFDYHSDRYFLFTCRDIFVIKKSNFLNIEREKYEINKRFLRYKTCYKELAIEFI